jgi:hypothetical protein
VAEGVDPFGKKPGPAGSAVAQRQSNGRDTAMDLKDMARKWCIEVWLYGRTKAVMGAHIEHSYTNAFPSCMLLKPLARRGLGSAARVRSY